MIFEFSVSLLQPCHFAQVYFRGLLLAVCLYLILCSPSIFGRSILSWNIFLKAITTMKVNKAAALDRAITAEALQGGGDQVISTIHAFCSKVYTTLSPSCK